MQGPISYKKNCGTTADLSAIKIRKAREGVTRNSILGIIFKGVSTEDVTIIQSVRQNTMGLLGAIVFDIVSFVLIWIFVSIAIHVTAALIGTKKPFSKALLMAFVLAVVFILIYAFIPTYWWLTLILYFVLMMVAFINTYDMKVGQAFAAAIVVVVIAIILLIIILFLLVGIIILI